MTSQYLRKISLVVGNATDGIDLSQLQISFQITQATIQAPQFSNIRIYNLSADTAKAIKANEYTHVVLQAGYQQEPFGFVFEGDIVQARLGRESAVDTYMDILAAEGYAAHQSVANITLAAGATALDLAKAAAQAMGAALVNYVTDPAPKLPRGQSTYGMARDAMNLAAASMSAVWYYVGTTIELVPKATGKPMSAIKISAATGMIGWPEQTQEGITFRTLMNPKMQVGSAVQIDNASILRAQVSADYQFVNTYPGTDADGLYRSLRVQHRGNTRGQEWYSDVVAIAVDPSAAGLSSLVQQGQF